MSCTGQNGHPHDKQMRPDGETEVSGQEWDRPLTPGEIRKGFLAGVLLPILVAALLVGAIYGAYYLTTH